MGAAQTKDGAEQACDGNQRSQVCHDKNSICIAFYRNEGGLHLFSRHCASRDGFEKSKMRCDKSILTGRECTVAMCEESGCTAELPVHKPGTCIYMLWLRNFILGLNFIFLSFILIFIHYHTQKQRLITLKHPINKRILPCLLKCVVLTLLFPSKSCPSCL